ncbi:hypothetical protein J3R30DRAFT_229929 [Lentinula aciculospora]|uniref:Uncharacterized protein n=1 Tax=Lentinula aciculospora TaxID=153920 RepID=A0A9W9AA65_9AGAR|nr:hypothetical protein J3R30DRAFT_229929 [Lentinula aciculospora]
MTLENATTFDVEKDSKGWSSHNGRDYFRLLGESEYAYYVPALRNGLNDMFLHSSFTAKFKTTVMDPSRIALCWAITRCRHPLLMAQVLRDRNSGISQTSEEEPYFWFSPPKNAVKEATESLVFNSLSKDELISNYLNGPRTLSDERMSYLVVSTSAHPEPPTPDDEGKYDLLMCAPHFIGDGASLHQCTHELMTLLASSLKMHDLKKTLKQPPNWVELLPPALESRLPILSSGIGRAAAKVNYLQTLHKEIGGHTLRRRQREPQKTVMMEKSFSEEDTVKILARCKKSGVTINHALFALCNVAWGHSNLDFQAIKLPMMMYTALNLRPYLTPHPSSTCWFLALTYFNVVLPSFMPGTIVAFWNRARSVKAQTRKVVQSPFLTYRAMTGAKGRAARVRGTPDRIVRPPTTFVPSSNPGLASESIAGPVVNTSTALPASINNVQAASGDIKLPSAPSAALFGLSLIGNLDNIYTQSTSYSRRHISGPSSTSPSSTYNSISSAPSFPFPSAASLLSALYPSIQDPQSTDCIQIINIHTVTTASRQKPGGLLLLEHTFAKKLWLHLCWDVNGFEAGHIERFWECLEDAVEELLISN